MPGVEVTTGVRTGPLGGTTAPAATFFVAGSALRGPTDKAVLVRSLAEFRSKFGGFDSGSDLYQHLEVFFEEGGSQAYVARAVGDGATAATGRILDASNAGSSSGSGDYWISLTAVGEGTWANDEALTVTVSNGAASGSYRLLVTYDEEVVFQTGDLFTRAQMIGALNSGAGNYIVATAGASTESAPAPGTYSLSGGVNGSVPVVSDVALALDLFGPELGAGAVALPNFTGTDAWDALQDHAITNRRIAICAFAEGQDISGAPGAITNYYGSTALQQEQASYLGFYFPWVQAPDGSGGTRNLSPEAFVAAARSRAHVEVGPWRPGAGEISAAKFVTGVTYNINKGSGDTLDAARINAIRVINGSARVYGARSASSDEANWRFITYRDMINYITVESEARLEDWVFAGIDSRRTIFGEISAALVNILEPIRQSGGVVERRDANGNIVDRGYTVEVSDAINPLAQLAEGVVAAKVGVRPSSVGDTITVNILKSGLTTAV